MADDVFNVCRGRVAAQVTALELATGDRTVPVIQRKYPAEDEGYETLPLILVCLSPSQGRAVPLDSGGTRRQDVAVQVLIVSAGNRDPDRDLDLHPGWLARIAAACSGPRLGPGISGLLACAVSTDRVIDRTLDRDNYDYSGLTVSLSVEVPG